MRPQGEPGSERLTRHSDKAAIEPMLSAQTGRNEKRSLHPPTAALSELSAIRTRCSPAIHFEAS
jgi:hypothetical protein